MGARRERRRTMMGDSYFTSVSTGGIGMTPGLLRRKRTARRSLSQSRARFPTQTALWKVGTESTLELSLSPVSSATLPNCLFDWKSSRASQGEPAKSRGARMGFYLELLFDLHLCLSDDGVRARRARHSPARCADPCRCATGSGSRAECFELVSATRPGGGAALERGRCGRGERVADRSWRGEHHGGLARQPARGAGRPGTRPRHANDAIERVSRVHRSRDDRTRARRSPRDGVRLDPRLDPSPSRFPTTSRARVSDSRKHAY